MFLHRRGWPSGAVNLAVRGFEMLTKIGGVVVAVASGSAFAEVPLAVTTALTDGKADAIAVAGLALVIVIGIAVIKYMRQGV